MKRPLAWVCLALVFILAVRHGYRGSPEDSLLAMTEDILASADAQGRVTLWGTVDECSALSEGMRISIYQISIQNTNVQNQSFRSDLKLTFTTTEEGPAPGDMLKLSGKIREFEPASNPGQFDARKWYFSQKIACALQDAEILELIRGPVSLERTLHLLRGRIRKSYADILEDKAARIISAITLGEKGLLEQEWKDIYQEGGIAHILAISGLHISMIGMGLYALLRKAGAGFLSAAIAGGAVIVLYTLMTGHGVSAVRAAVMFGLWLGSQICGRKQDMVTAAAVAALLLVLADSGNVTQASFLLSFGAILSLGIILPGMQNALGAEKSAFQGILAGCALWLGTLPCTLWFYYQAVPWSPLVNLAVIPLMSALMGAGLLSAVTGLLCRPLGIFLAAPVSYILQFFEWLCVLEKKLPQTIWVTGRPRIWKIVLYYAILALALLFTSGARGERIPAHFRNNRLLKNILVWTACSAIGLLLMSGGRPRELTVICMDVGQGDGALIRLPDGENCLIDGGSSTERGLWDNILSQTVKYYGVQTLDYIFLSHADQDHVSGVKELLEEYDPGFAGKNTHGVSVKNLVLPPTAEAEDFQELAELAGEKGIHVLQMERGGGISRENSWSIVCLAPQKEALCGDRNQDSMVLALRYGSFSMLFTGDLEAEAEQELAGSGQELRADILKVGHHGSANASSGEFLAQVAAKFAVISCAENNVYGHPSPDTLARLEAAGCEVLQTAETGAVTVRTDGDSFSVETFLSKTVEGN